MFPFWNPNIPPPNQAIDGNQQDIMKYLSAFSRMQIHPDYVYTNYPSENAMTYKNNNNDTANSTRNPNQSQAFKQSCSSLSKASNTQPTQNDDYDRKLAQYQARYIAQKIYAEKCAKETPPAEPLDHQELLDYQQRIFSDYNQFEEYFNEQEENTQGNCLRSTPDWSSVNAFNTEDDNHCVNNIKAIPMQLFKETTPNYLSTDGYEAMRRNFESNGFEFNTSPTTSKSIFRISEFPPLIAPVETPSEGSVEATKMPQSPSIDVVYPMQSMNFQMSPGDERKKNKPHKKSLETFCVFCHNNGEDEKIYMNHTVLDYKGRTLCPRLRLYVCPICGADGDYAHTTHYCPQKKVITPQDLLANEVKMAKARGSRRSSRNRLR